MMKNFQELLQRAQDGDEASLATLIALFEPLINRCAREAMSQEREDLKQELTAKLILLIKSYQPLSFPKST